MKHCSDCGQKLIRLVTDSSWVAKFRCPCGKRYQIAYGDRMGGSSDVYSSFDKPFNNEEDKK